MYVVGEEEEKTDYIPLWNYSVQLAKIQLRQDWIF